MEHPCTGVICSDCGTQFPYEAGTQPHMEDMGPCPSCGSMRKTADLRFTVEATAYPLLQGCALPAGTLSKNKAYLIFKQGYDFFRKGGTWSLLKRVIDRRNDHYFEHIEDVETGRVIKHKDEKLRDHTAEHVSRRDR